MKKLTMILALVAVMLTPSLAHAAAIPCKTYDAYQDHLMTTIAHADYVDTMQEFAESDANILTLSPSKLKTYGTAMLDFSDDLHAMTHVDPLMQPYHRAEIDLFGTTGQFMVDASSMGVMTAALIYQDQLTEVTDTYNLESAKLPTGCGNSI